MRQLQLFLAVSVSLFAAGCVDDDFSLVDPVGGAAGGTGGTGGTGGGGTTPVSAVVDMGNGSGTGFVPDMIAIAVPTLSSGGSTALDISLVDTAASNALYSAEVVDVTYTSLCLAAGTADIRVLSVSTNPVSSGTGFVQATYVATGCSGPDVITATTQLAAGGTLQAMGTVTVVASGAGSISFISATPQLIGLQGTGGLGFDETSTVVFKVVDSGGAAVVGADVNFSLSTAVGGITLSPGTATSDSAGEVQTVVTSGTVATSVRVTADVVGASPAIGTQSSVLVVSTGLPDQDSFSWAVACPNVEAWGYDGVENVVTVILSDRFQNPVPDGTAVSFTAEGGSIQSNCQTTTTGTQSGTCSVTWTSSNPRPADGRVSLLATAIGEESFVDVNGNGLFDDPDSFTDLPEAFRDENENLMHDPGEFFLDFDGNFIYGTGDTLFNGLLCQDTTGRCSASETTGIGASGLIIMSGSTAVITDNLGVGDLVLPPLATNTVTFTIGDLHGQPMPGGTSVKFTTGNGKIIGPSEYIVGCTSNNGPLMYSFVVEADTTPSSSAGVLEVATTGPGVGTGGGTTTTYFITVTD